MSMQSTEPAVAASSGPTGVLLVNLGTPESPAVADVRCYLKEFLWDPRVVELSRPAWWLVLNLVILNTRPRRSARAYAKVWTDAGSPLLVISRRQHAALQAELDLQSDVPVKVALENRGIFLEAGGKQYSYIPCLNDDVSHIRLFSELVSRHTQGWV